MERKYTILAVLLIILALGLIVLPKKNDRKETEPKVLLSSVAERSRYLTTDLVTHRIIENDPSLLLIDLRTASQYKAFSLPGAINILPDSLLNKSYTELLNQPGKDKVFFANSDLVAEKAWLICTRFSVERIYIMKGGMNEWFNTIIKPTVASATSSSAELDLISFRNAARQFFTGTGQSTVQSLPANAPEKVQVVRKAATRSAGGGC